MANIIDTLHPKSNPSDNLYPNIKADNIPSGSVSMDKLSGSVISAITSATPKIFDTSANILALTSDGGVAVATDTGYIYIWNTSNSIYEDTGVLYQATGIADGSITASKMGTLVTSVYRGILATNSDLDDVKDSSRYMLLRSYTYSNLPRTISYVYSYALLETICATGTNVKQIYTDADGNISYYRIYSNGSWSNWNFIGSIYNNVNAASMDIDTITLWGTYTVQSTSTGTLPETITNYGILNVEWASTTSQMQTLSIYLGNIYRRFIQNGVCSEWVKIYDPTFPNGYNKPYVYNKKVVCNKVNNTTTAYYTGVDVGDGKVINVFNVKYIWESTTTSKVNSGVLALIINPNGCGRITQITDLSLHLQITATTIKLDILGNTYGSYYYQNLIDTTLTNAQSLDGETVYEVTMAVSGNNVYVYVDGTDTYTGTFTPDSNITSLNDVLGQYAIFEHYCNGDMDTYCMPMFTKVLLRENSDVLVWDDFIREDGILNNTPQGIAYHLFTNTFNF